ncbi:MAG: thioredoxin [Deltaproteobacteria bacterium]|nr:MAG: thioredoxin [Deltaproteobacteria bacterium]
MSENLTEVADSNFDKEVLQSDTPVLVDFWAPWCGPCKAIGPIVDQLADSFSGQVKFAKCNVDDNPATPGKYGIQSIPTLMIFKDGQVSDQVVGMVGKGQLEKMINGVLSGKASSQPFVVS